MMGMISRYVDRNFGTALTVSILGLVFIIASFVVYGVSTRAAKADETQPQVSTAQQTQSTPAQDQPQQVAETQDDKKVIYIFDKDGKKVAIKVRYDPAKMVPGLRTTLTCKGPDGKIVHQEMAPMGTLFHNNPQHITTVNNKGLREWIVPLGGFLCVEEEYKE